LAFWVYILRCADGGYYTGHTDDLTRRIAEHESGAVPGYTSARHPLQLVFSQEIPSREEALAAERQIKRWSRRKKEALIAGDWTGLRTAAKKNFESE
jgi:predicted GIY-YIG superfamily endonuclease